MRKAGFKNVTLKSYSESKRDRRQQSIIVPHALGQMDERTLFKRDKKKRMLLSFTRNRTYWRDTIASALKAYGL